jgi:hypothetical protein
LDEQINQRIAEACGWKPAPRGRWKLNEHVERFRPDYLNDLNAMHEAVKSLPQNLKPRYFAYLCAVVSGAISLNGYSEATEATAAQRAKAFLRTLNLWKP